MTAAVRNRHILAVDALALALLPTLEYYLRFESLRLAPPDVHSLVWFTALSAPIKLAIFIAAGLYTRLWAHAGFRDFTRAVTAAALAAAITTALFAVLLPVAGLIPARVPVSVLALDAFASLTVVLGTRATVRLLATPAASASWQAPDTRPTLVVGAGAAGKAVAEELHAHPEWGLRLVGFADDDPGKQARLLAGHPVLGTLADIPELIKSHGVRDMIFAMPRARGAVMRSLLRTANAAGVHTQTVPALFELLSGRVSVSSLRKVEIRDLLGRDAVSTDLSDVRAVVGGRTVLVTGAGGSIGSELCRQLAPLGPRRLLLLGHGENSIFDVQLALAEMHPAVDAIPLIADVRDRRHLQRLFARYRPDVVFHAAAHKHVPLMEANVAEAVLNNVAGTRNVVAASLAAGVAHFVLISSDKAVRPCSVMGATKRIAEMLVQQAGTLYCRNFVVVRLGNVLGSRGSVVPIFLRQIQAGGPVMVTHPDMQRYFMTIPEAVQLIMQAGALGRHGNVFVLDMGDPVRIVDLATDLVRLSGLEPHEDIEIRFSGVRPGERLFEEILFSGESVTPTSHPKVLRATNVSLPRDLSARVRDLTRAARHREKEAHLRRLIADLVTDARVVRPGHARPVEPLPGAASSTGTGRVVPAGPDPGV